MGRRLFFGGIVALLAGLGGCGDAGVAGGGGHGGNGDGAIGDGPNDGPGDATSTDGAKADAPMDGPPGDGPGSDAPGDGAPSTFDPEDMLARLSGEKPITGTTTIPSRDTLERRRIARDYLADSFKALGLEPKLHSYMTTARGPGDNVYAELPSTDGGTEWVVLGAHYDSAVGVPGANDNASGTTLVYVVADRLVATPKRSRNVMFVLFDQEEGDPATMTALVGSKQFASALVAMKRTVDSVHTVDQVGWDADGDRAIELESPATGIRTLYEDVVKAKSLAVPVKATPVTTSDHQSFRAKGFRATGVTEEYAGGDTTPYFHKPGNKYSTINWDYFDSCARVVTGVFERLVE